jgi:hypothetical protein
MPPRFQEKCAECGKKSNRYSVRSVTVGKIQPLEAMIASSDLYLGLVQKLGQVILAMRFILNRCKTAE